MPRKTWTLSDVDADIYLESVSLGSDQAGGAAKGYSVTKRTLRGGLREGVDVVEVDNGRFRFVVVPTRGMGIWRASCGDLQLGWKSPVHGPVHPALVPLWEPSGIGWLGGFDELLVRCGLESNGAPEFLPNGALRYALHGKIANIPARKVQVTIDGDSGEIAISGVVEEARLFGNKLRMTTTISTRAGQPGMTVTDEITNLSAEPGELELLYHINFGVPLVTPGAGSCCRSREWPRTTRWRRRTCQHGAATVPRRRVWARRAFSSIWRPTPRTKPGRCCVPPLATGA